MSRPPYKVPSLSGDQKQQNRQIVDAVRGIMGGKQNNIADVTLKPNVTSTVMKDSRLSAFSHLSFTPVTADAAALAQAGAIWPSARGNGSATITHPSSSSTDLTFTVEIAG